jgi:hypothetical protein
VSRCLHAGWLSTGVFPPESNWSTMIRRKQRKDTQGVRREPCKVLIFSGCNAHPATGSLQPVASEATRGGNETVGAFETDGSL